MELSATSFSLKKNTLDNNRPIANFHPSVWGNYFLKYSEVHTQIDGVAKEQHEQLKEEVRNKFVVMSGKSDDPSGEHLKLIDAIQRLGVAYHFETEIGLALNNHLVNLDNNNISDDDLNIVSLCFRLLRQHGHRISCGIFDKFKDYEGRFKESMVNEVKGLLGLYEAAHMRGHNEDILDEALEFTTTHLKKLISSSSINRTLKSQVVLALNQPIRKGLTRLEARNYMPIYEQDESHDEKLLKFAKLDFNMLQKVHQRELCNITRWWKDFNIEEKLPFARDRLVECYFWILGVYYEPHYSFARWILTKVMAMSSVIDDIYDSYATYEEIIVFTNAIHRWDINAADELPEYMRHVYKTLLDVYTEMEGKLSKEETSYRVEYAKQAMKQLVKAYFDEATWYHEAYVPTVEEYLNVSLVTSGYTLLAITSLVGMEVSVPKETFDWVSNSPLIVKAASAICRLTDDLVGHEVEQERGHVASVVECYMKQYGATKEEARVELSKRITNAWKDINQECLVIPTAVTMASIERILNLARVIDLLYKDVDGYTNSNIPRVKGLVTSLLITSVSI